MGRKFKLSHDINIVVVKITMQTKIKKSRDLQSAYLILFSLPSVLFAAKRHVRIDERQHEFVNNGSLYSVPSWA